VPLEGKINNTSLYPKRSEGVIRPSNKGRKEGRRRKNEIRGLIKTLGGKERRRRVIQSLGG
jgi:hypothetical protein